MAGLSIAKVRYVPVSPLSLHFVVMN
jgi:hypothetical protein